MRLAVLAILTVLAAPAADLTGIWIGSIHRGNGDPIEVAFKLVQKGDRVEGKLYGDYGSTPIVEGSVTNGDVTFFVVASEQAGNQINSSRLRFSGRLTGDQLQLSRLRESSSDAGNGANAPQRANTPQLITLKRLI